MDNREQNFDENHFAFAAAIPLVESGLSAIGKLFDSGPDISQRQKDYARYVQKGFVKGGNPKDDNTWIFDLDWLKANQSSEPGYYNAIFNFGSPNAQKIMDRWANYKAIMKPQTAQDKAILAKQIVSGQVDVSPSKLKDIFAPEINALKNTASNALQDVSNQIAQANTQSNLPANKSINTKGGISGAASLSSIAGNIPMVYLVGGGIVVVLVLVMAFATRK